MAKIFRTALFGYSSRVALIVLLAVDLSVVFGGSRYWVGVWSETSAVAQSATFYVAPLAAAFSAWQASQSAWGNKRIRSESTASGSCIADAALLSASLVLALTVYGVGVVAATITSAFEATAGFVWPSYILLGLATMVSFGAAGHLVGRRLSNLILAPLVCAVGGFLLVLTFGQSLGMVFPSGHPAMHMQQVPLAIRGVLAVGLAALAVVASTGLVTGDRPRGLRFRLPRSWPAASLVLVFAALIGVGVAGPVRDARAATDVVPVCGRVSDSAPRVCVWPEHQIYLPRLILMAQRIDDIPQNWIETPSVFYEDGLRRSEGAEGFLLMRGHVRSAAVGMTAKVSELSIDSCAPPDDARRLWEAVNRIDLWLEYRAMGGDPVMVDRGMNMTGAVKARKASSRAVAMTEKEQYAWVARELDYVRGIDCGE